MQVHFLRLFGVPALVIALAASSASLPAQQDGSNAGSARAASESPAFAAQLAPAPSEPPAQPSGADASTLPLAPPDVAETGSMTGTVLDAQDELVPGAAVTLDGATPNDHRETFAGDNGAFRFVGLKPGAYHLTISANGFVTWTSPTIALSVGQYQVVQGIHLELVGNDTSVTVYASPQQLSTEQVNIALEQRVFGVVPNFYVAYDHNAPPLTAKSKFQLALRVSDDPITIAGVLFMAGVNQGVRIPDYRLGAEGYGERVGSVAADGFSDIFFGGAVLPALLHQDPRYFYQGTGTKTSRLLHALAGPFVCRGDNGHMEPNFSTVGGDIISAGFSNLYYPSGDRTWTFFGENVMISTIERTASTVTQEFVLGHLTSKGKNRHRDSIDAQ